MTDGNEKDISCEKERHPSQAPAEKTGLTPEEELYVPPAEVRPIRRRVAGTVAAVFLMIFAVGGTMYYRSNILPERLYQSAARSMQDGDFEEARRQYEDVYRLKPERRDTLFQLAYSQERLGDVSSAAESYRKHLENQPGDMDAMRRLSALLFADERYDEALPFYEEILARQPSGTDDPDLHYALGYIYGEKGDDALAASHYAAFVDSGVEDPDILLTVSKVLMKLGRYEDALAGFTKAGDYLASGDTRAFHAKNAAKNMLGWPTDDEMVITPGESIGNMKLGLTFDEALRAWGKPMYEVAEGEHSVWGYGDAADAPLSLVYFESGIVIEIVTMSPGHRTSDGLSLGNFMDPKYSGRFRRTRDETSETKSPVMYRYLLKDGGLAFYLSGERSHDKKAVVYSHGSPLTEDYGMQWRYFWD